MGLREAKTSQQIRKTKLQSVPGGKKMIIMKGRSKKILNRRSWLSASQMVDISRIVG